MIFLSNLITRPLLGLVTIALTILVFFTGGVVAAEAATLSLSPATGVYPTGSTFTARVMINTAGKSVNAAEGTISFNPNELSVVSVNRAGSIFNLWVTEPTFSNSGGTINFSGGSPMGYSGSGGAVMNIVFRSKTAGTARVQFTKGSVLANDGKGTNVLTAMNGGSYTLQAKSLAPEPEVIEYVAPANTPSRPEVTSSTHPDSSQWYALSEAKLSWEIPAGVTAVRTLLNDNPTSIPTKVYDNPIKNIILSNLDQGVSYFHLQFKNADGWGKVAHYRLAVDTVKPENITIKETPNQNPADPARTLSVEVLDKTSLVDRFKVKLDAAPPYEIRDETGSGTVKLPVLEPGYHAVIIEAFDQAGNSIVGTYSFTIEAFSPPIFTEYPTEINDQVIPVIKGSTRPNAKVEINLTRLGTEPRSYSVKSDQAGNFVFIPEGRFELGVYEITGRATDEFGAISEQSNPIRLIVEQPGILKIGSYIVDILSVFVPLLLLMFLLIAAFWYFVLYIKRFRRRVRIESIEALEILRREFAELRKTISIESAKIAAGRKTGKLTKSEASLLDLFSGSLNTSEEKVRKEITDIAELTKKKNNKKQHDEK